MLQKKNSTAGSLMLIVTALIWGLAFSAQRSASASLDAISFNTFRFVFATAVLIPAVLIFDFVKKKKGIKPIGWNKTTVIGGMLCGAILFIANNLQQLGVESTSAGKASFITSIYIVIVPIFGLLAGRKPQPTGWFAVVVAIAGFWMMSITDDFSVTTGDLMVLLCAFMFSFQILFTDIFGENNDAIKFTLVEFATGAVISIPAMAINGFPQPEAIQACILPLLYVGIMSSGVAFTLQTAGQQRTEPAIATLLMSLESVFGLFGGIIILHESSTVKELGGCLLVFVAVFLAEQIRNEKYLSITPAQARILRAEYCSNR